MMLSDAFCQPLDAESAKREFQHVHVFSEHAQKWVDVVRAIPDKMHNKEDAFSVEYDVAGMRCRKTLMASSPHLRIPPDGQCHAPDDLSEHENESKELDPEITLWDLCAHDARHGQYRPYKPKDVSGAASTVDKKTIDVLGHALLEAQHPDSKAKFQPPQRHHHEGHNNRHQGSNSHRYYDAEVSEALRCGHFDIAQAPLGPPTAPVKVRGGGRGPLPGPPGPGRAARGEPHAPRNVRGGGQGPLPGGLRHAAW